MSGKQPFLGGARDDEIWQQEHYSLAPPRGQGLHRLWLPWVATSQRNGIFGLMDFDPKLFEDLAARRQLDEPVKEEDKSVFRFPWIDKREIGHVLLRAMCRVLGDVLGPLLARRLLGPG
jgi:hypothetical protein